MTSLTQVAPVITAAAASVALIGGYVKFVLRAAVLPCVEFDVDFVPLPIDDGRHVGDVVLSIRNVGPGSGYIADIQGRIRYAEHDEIDTTGCVELPFPHRIPAPVTVVEEEKTILESGFLFHKDWGPAFIQPGVTQIYRKPVVVPDEATVFHVWAAFHYRTELHWITRKLARTLVNDRARDTLDYTVRRTFAGSSPLKGSSAALSQTD